MADNREVVDLQLVRQIAVLTGIVRFGDQIKIGVLELQPLLAALRLSPDADLTGIEPPVTILKIGRFAGSQFERHGLRRRPKVRYPLPVARLIASVVAKEDRHLLW